MGFSVNGLVNNSSNEILKLGELGSQAVKDGLNNLFDLEDPVGVHALIRDKNKGNSLKSSDDEDSSLNLAGVHTTITAENKKAPYGNTLYIDENDSYEYKSKDATGADKITQVGPRPYSVFNKYSLVNFRGTILTPEGASTAGKSEFFNKIEKKSLVNPTASRIIELTGAVAKNSGYRYQYSDFAMARYFGKIPNNMMVTLRRFAFPAPDDIISPVGLSGESLPQPDIARAVTWMGEAPGNALSDILNFSHGFGWKEAEAEVQTLQSKQGKKSGSVGAFIQGDRLLSAAANAKDGGTAYSLAVKNANAGYDAFSETYPNHVFGPLNVIKKVLVREQGLNFDQEFKLKFEYELRDLGGANPKILMMDQLANILALTYNNAPFWGGDVRYIGDGSVSKPLGDMDMLKGGDYVGFMKSVVSDVTGSNSGNVIDDLAAGFKDAIGGGIEKTLKSVLGGGLMKMFNSPQGGQSINALLTGDPTGQWHVTIGNPLNPIAVIGNLACTDTSISFEGPMGVQDFPERLVVEISLKPARPRDKAEIESMFNSGRGRFYIQPKDVLDVNATTNVSPYGKAQTTIVDGEMKKIVNG